MAENQDFSEDDLAEVTPPISPRSDSSLRAHKRENKKALKLLGHDPSKSKLKDRLGLTDDEAEVVERTGSNPTLTVTAAPNMRGGKRERRKSEPMIDKRINKKALEVLGVDASRAKVQDLLGFTNDDEAELARSQSLQSVHDQPEDQRSSSQSAIPHTVNKKEVQKALAILGLDISKAKASEMLGIADEPSFPHLEEEFADHIVCTM